MNAITALTQPRVVRQPLTLVLIGGLAMHGHLDATAITESGEVMGLDASAQARAVLDLIDRGLASVSREGSDGQLLATPALVRFSNTSAGDELLARVRSGDVTCVSFGYAIEAAERAPDKDGLPVVRATRWVAKEISFVAIPADPTVGYGRSDGGDVATISVTEKDAKMAKDEIKDTIPATPKPDDAPQNRGDNQPSQADILTAERTRADGIDEIATRFEVPDNLVRDAKKKGISVEAFSNLTLDYLGSNEAEATRAGATMIGLNEKEKESFSVVKLLRSLANPTEGRFKKDAGFELEAVAAATDSHKGQVRGVILPTDITMHVPQSMRTRASDQLAGTANLGGNLVDDVLMSGSMIDVLRNVSVLSQMGVRVFGGLSGDVSFPKHLTDVSAFWVAEDGSATQSGMTFGQVKMSPRTCAAMTELSRRLLLQTSADIEAYARMSIVSSIALKIDSAGLNGDADANAPDGLADEAGVNEVNFASAGAPTYAEVVNMRTQVKKQNAMLGSLGYVLSPDIEEHLLTTPKFAGGEAPIMADEGRLGGYRATATNQSPVD